MQPTRFSFHPEAVDHAAPPRAGVARPALSILGTRGIPARHSGFETFAERLALHLAAKGWRVTVYCQGEARAGSPAVQEAMWHGIRLVTVNVRGSGALSTVVFDWHCARLAQRDPGTLLTLGYNTAVFGVLFRGRRHVINMDGIEWRRAKWSAPVKAWFYLNERIACRLGDPLVADNPAIRAHLATRTGAERIAMIPYGADPVVRADVRFLERYGVQPDRYALIVARPEPENSVLETVRAFSARPRGLRLVVLGRYAPSVPFQRRVLEAASGEVVFAGAVFERPILDALRLYCRFYIHGHTVGGTNPTLVEALGAGCAVLAHDNRFNRWVAGADAAFFLDEAECGRQMDALAANDVLVQRLRAASRERFSAFGWDGVLEKYEALLQEVP